MFFFYPQMQGHIMSLHLAPRAQSPFVGHFFQLQHVYLSLSTSSPLHSGYMNGGNGGKSGSVVAWQQPAGIPISLSLFLSPLHSIPHTNPSSDPSVLQLSRFRFRPELCQQASVQVKTVDTMALKGEGLNGFALNACEQVH